MRNIPRFSKKSTTGVRSVLAIGLAHLISGHCAAQLQAPTGSAIEEVHSVSELLNTQPIAPVDAVASHRGEPIRVTAVVDVSHRAREWRLVVEKNRTATLYVGYGVGRLSEGEERLSEVSTEPVTHKSDGSNGDTQSLTISVSESYWKEITTTVAQSRFRELRDTYGRSVPDGSSLTLRVEWANSAKQVRLSFGAGENEDDISDLRRFAELWSRVRGVAQDQLTKASALDERPRLLRIARLVAETRQPENPAE